MTEFGAGTAVAAALAALMVLGGCQRSVSSLDTRGVPAALPPAPIGVVESQSLDPAGPAQLPGVDPVAVGQQPLPDPMAAPPTEVASLTPPTEAPVAPPPAAEPVTREAMAGTWTVATDNPECRIILAFTKWSGGYRAATRRCEAAELTSVSAWDVKDNRVVLVDASGNSIASLYSAGPERYDGTTAGGRKVTFSR